MKRIALLVVLAARVAAADPWVDPRPGHGTFFFGFSDTRADQYFAGPQMPQAQFGGFPPPPLRAGQLYPLTVPLQTEGAFFASSVRSTYSTQTMLMTGDLSLGKHFGFAFSAPMLENVSEHATDGAGTASFLGWGDLVLGVKFQVPLPTRAHGFAFGPQLWLTTPTGNQDARGVLSGAKSSVALPLQTGTGTVDLEARLSAGYDFAPIPVFVVAELGYHHHLDDQTFAEPGTQPIHTSYSDDLRYLVRAGGTLALHRRGFHHGTLSLDLSGVRSLHNGSGPGYDPSPFLTFAGQFNNATSFSMGASVRWFPVRWVGLSYSVSHVLSGENTGYFLTNTVGIVSEF